jgi:excisionase family DNA binding protein
VNEGRPAWHAGEVSEPRVTDDVLSSGPDGPREWLPVAEVAGLLDVSPGRVRRLVQERALAGMRRGKEFRVPAELVKDGAPLPELQGTLVVLADAGFSDEEALRWLFTDDGYPGTPVDALRSGRGKTEVRRRAQALAL